MWDLAPLEADQEFMADLKFPFGRSVLPRTCNGSNAVRDNHVLHGAKVLTRSSAPGRLCTHLRKSPDQMQGSHALRMELMPLSVGEQNILLK